MVVWLHDINKLTVQYNVLSSSFAKKIQLIVEYDQKMLTSKCWKNKYVFFIEILNVEKNMQLNIPKTCISELLHRNQKILRCIFWALTSSYNYEGFNSQMSEQKGIGKQ